MNKSTVRGLVTGTIESYTSWADSALNREMNRLTGMVKSDADDWITVKDNEKTTTYHFFDDKLYGVKFSPNLPDAYVNPLTGSVRAADQPTAEASKAILSTLVEKYGHGEGIIKGLTNEAHFPLLVYRWNDGETTIQYIMWDPDWCAANLSEKAAFSSLSVEYTSNAIADVKINAEKAISERKHRQMREKEGDKYKDNL